MPFISNMPDIQKNGLTYSNYKMLCFVCQKNIERGDAITQCVETGGHYSMTLRARKIKGDTSFYTPDTGARWVHKHCNSSTGWTCWSGLEYNRLYYD